jgi:hypothetical protein
MSQSEIADIAVMMLEKWDYVIGEPTLALLRNLLSVDTRRRAIAKRPLRAFEKAARKEARNEGRITLRALARFVGVDPHTIIRWRKLPQYKAAVEREKRLSKSARKHPPKGGALLTF